MKKSFSLAFALLVLFSCLVSSCKNFASNALYEYLENSILYANEPFANITIESPNSITESIIPPAGVYQASYKKEDVIKLSFTPTSEYYFLHWDATPNNAVSFFDNTQNETTVEIISTEKPITIKPVCAKRPAIILASPTYSITGANRGSPITIIFDQEISLDSIYYTEKELQKLGIPKSNYDDDFYKAKKYDNHINSNEATYEDTYTLLTNSNNEQYYFAYLDSTTNSLIYKNIQIYKQDTNESLLQKGYFSCPYFDSKYNLVIPIEKNTSNNPKQLPPLSDIRILLSKNIQNKDGIPLGKDFPSVYRTGNVYDIEGPYKTGFESIQRIQTYLLDPENTNELIFQDNRTNPDNKIYDMPTQEQIETSESLDELLNTNHLIIAKNLSLQLPEIYITEGSSFDKIEFKDNSGVLDVTLNLEPVINKIYPNQKTETIRFSQLSDFSNIEYDLSSAPLQGIYKVYITAQDIYGNTSYFNNQVLDLLQNSTGSYLTKPTDVFVLIDNLTKPDPDSFILSNIKSTTGNYSNGKYIYTASLHGQKGLYVLTYYYEKIINQLEMIKLIINADDDFIPKTIKNDDLNTISIKCICPNDFKIFGNPSGLMLIHVNVFGNITYKTFPLPD